jgi:hypothetical protein
MYEAFLIKSVIVWLVLYGAFVAHVYRDLIKKFLKNLLAKYGTYRGRIPPPSAPPKNEDKPKEDK